jgi:hypothetical protein
MNNVYNVLRNLRNIFHQHPIAENFKIPEWLENGKVKTF